MASLGRHFRAFSGTGERKSECEHPLARDDSRGRLLVPVCMQPE